MPKTFHWLRSRCRRYGSRFQVQPLAREAIERIGRLGFFVNLDLIGRLETNTMTTTICENVECGVAWTLLVRNNNNG